MNRSILSAISILVILSGQCREILAEDSSDIQEKSAKSPYYYESDYEINVSALIGIIISVILFIIGCAVLACFFCACCCFAGRRSKTNGQVIGVPIIIPTNQQAPPSYFYHQGPPQAGFTVNVLQNPQYQPPPPAAASEPIAPNNTTIPGPPQQTHQQNLYPT